MGSTATPPNPPKPWTNTPSESVSLFLIYNQVMKHFLSLTYTTPAKQLYVRLLEPFLLVRLPSFSASLQSFSTTKNITAGCQFTTTVSQHWSAPQLWAWPCLEGSNQSRRGVKAHHSWCTSCLHCPQLDKKVFLQVSYIFQCGCMQKNIFIIDKEDLFTITEQLSGPYCFIWATVSAVELQQGAQDNDMNQL